MKIYYKNILVQIFQDHWERFKECHPQKVTEHVDETEKKMMGCGQFKNGYNEYRCLACGEIEKVAFTCKSRFCLRCARVFLDRWLRNMSGYIFPWIEH